MGPLLSLAPAPLAGAVLLFAAGIAAAQSDRHRVDIGVATAYVDTSTVLQEWPGGGVGKLRYAGNDVEATRLFAQYRGRLSPSWSATVIADYVADGDAGLDLTEAFLDWRPVPRSANQHQLRFGAFYPPLSLENGAHGWESPFTYSYSAINTWLGEEIRPVGAEWSMRRRLARLGNAHEVRAFAAGFYGNDPAGTLLFWRGWSLHDRQSRLNDRLDIPDVPRRDASGTVIGLIPHAFDVFRETDHRPGAYAGFEWRYARRFLAQVARYDNRADPYSLSRHQWGWRTAFDHLALQATLPGEVGLVAQWMRGSTEWISGARPDGTFTATAALVEDDFDARFLLLTRKLAIAHRVALRYDTFEIVRPAATPVLHADAGHAWTLSYRFEPAARLSAGLEWLQIRSRRDLWPAFYGAPPAVTERQLRLQLTLRLGAPDAR